MAADSLPRLLIIGPRSIVGHEGGVEKFAEEFVPRAAPSTRIDALCLVAASRPLPPNVVVVQVPRSRFFRTDKAFYPLYALWLHAARRYDRIFILGMNFAILVPFMRLMFWRRSQIYVRTGSIDYVLPKWSRPMRWIMRFSESMMRHADRVMAVAPSLVTHLEARGIASRLLPNGLEKKGPAPDIRSRDGKVLAIGRVTAQKNYGVLIEAVKRLGDHAPDVMIIGGAGLSPEATALEEQCREAGGRARLAGRLSRQEVLERLRGASLYVNCSLHEGMSNAVLEAIQEGIAVILSDNEANRDFMLPDHHYFQPTDPDELGALILKALDQPQDFVVDVSRFLTWDKAIEGYLEEMRLRGPEPAGHPVAA